MALMNERHSWHAALALICERAKVSAAASRISHTIGIRCGWIGEREARHAGWLISSSNSRFQCQYHALTCTTSTTPMLLCCERPRFINARLIYQREYAAAAALPRAQME